MANKPISKLAEDEYLENQLRVLEFVNKEKKEATRKLKRIKDIDILKKEDSRALFEKRRIILKEGLYIKNKDLILYKLDLEYLKRIGIELEFLRSYYQQSKDETAMLYTEYYLCKESTCIIFVQYHFKHIVLLSKDNRTNLNTSVFVHSKSEVFCYNEFSGKQFLKQFDANMTIDDAKDILFNKQFQAYPAEDRVYYLYFSKSPEKMMMEKKEMKEIHLVVEQLLDLFLKERQNGILSSAKLKIETNFLKSSEKPVRVVTKLKYSYEDAGMIERMQNLLEYEMVLYFVNNPDEKVIAKFYLTQEEKEGRLILTQNDLEDAVLIDLKWAELCKENLYQNYYQRYCIDKEVQEEEYRRSIQEDITKMILKNIRVKGDCYEHLCLKDSFQKIYLETFEVLSKKLSEEYSMKPIREQRIACENGQVSQSDMYSIIYENTIYLVEIFSRYEAYGYVNKKFKIYLPALGISDIQIRILKPSKKSEIEGFVKGRMASSDKVRTYFYDRDNLKCNTYSKYSEIFWMDKWKKIFPDFNIDIKIEGKQSRYEIEEIDTERIYEKILKCINSEEIQTTRFTVKYPFRLDGDDEEETQEIPVTSNNMLYAYYTHDLDDAKVVNCPFEDVKEYSYSTGDDLLNIKLESTFYRTTFYEQISYLTCRCFTERKVMSQEIWKLCADFLLNNQKEE